MVGTVKQRIYVTAIPKGMSMRITALNLLPPVPPMEWRATLYDGFDTERVGAYDAVITMGPNHLSTACSIQF